MAPIYSSLTTLTGRGIQIPESKQLVSAATKWKLTEDSYQRQVQDNLLKFQTRLEKVEQYINTSVSCLTINVRDLNSKRYKLKAPLGVLVNKDQDCYVAETVDFNIFGVGEDAKDAIDNLKEVLISYYENLKSSKKKLSKNLYSKWRLLNSLISYERK